MLYRIKFQIIKKFLVPFLKKRWVYYSWPLVAILKFCFTETYWIKKTIKKLKASRSVFKVFLSIRVKIKSQFDAYPSSSVSLLNRSQNSHNPADTPRNQSRGTDPTSATSRGLLIPPSLWILVSHFPCSLRTSKLSSRLFYLGADLNPDRDLPQVFTADCKLKISVTVLSNPTCCSGHLEPGPCPPWPSCPSREIIRDHHRHWHLHWHYQISIESLVFSEHCRYTQM